MINDELPGTEYIYINELRDDLIDEKNVVPQFATAFEDFIYSMRCVEIKPHNVSKLELTKYDALHKKLQTQIETLRSDRKELESKYEKTIKAMKDLETTQPPPVYFNRFGNFSAKLLK